MKKLLSTCLTLTISMQGAFAAVDCRPFLGEVRQAMQAVRGFEQTLESMRAELQNAQSALQERQNLASSAQSTLARADQNAAQAQARAAQIRKSIAPQLAQLDGLRTQKTNLETKIARARETLRNLSSTPTPLPRPGRPGTPTPLPRPGTPGSNSNARDQLTRELNEMQREHERTVASIARIEASIAPQLKQIANLEQQVQAERQAAASARETISSLPRMRPSMQELQKRVAVASQALAGQDQVQARNMAALEQAQERHLMCVTYTTKYPVVLKEAKALAQQGCRNYRIPDFSRDGREDGDDYDFDLNIRDGRRGPGHGPQAAPAQRGRFETQAVRELIQSVCGR